MLRKNPSSCDGNGHPVSEGKAVQPGLRVYGFLIIAVWHEKCFQSKSTELDSAFLRLFLKREITEVGFCLWGSFACCSASFT